MHQFETVQIKNCPFFNISKLHTFVIHSRYWFDNYDMYHYNTIIKPTYILYSSGTITKPFIIDIEWMNIVYSNEWDKKILRLLRVRTWGNRCRVSWHKSITVTLSVTSRPVCAYLIIYLINLIKINHHCSLVTLQREINFAS